MMKFLKFALFAGIVVIGYSMWKFQMTTTREIISYGLVKATSLHNKGELVGRTREIQRGDLRFWEVELPDKSWVDCKKDCADALRKGALAEEEEEEVIPY
jgi:hypothetical protein